MKPQEVKKKSQRMYITSQQAAVPVQTLRKKKMRRLRNGKLKLILRAIFIIRFTVKGNFISVVAFPDSFVHHVYCLVVGYQSFNQLFSLFFFFFTIYADGVPVYKHYYNKHQSSFLNRIYVTE